MQLDDDAVTIPKKTLLAWEKEHVGIYLSENPLEEIQSAARRRGLEFESIADLDSESVGQSTRLICLVSSVRRIVTRTNRSMAILSVEDLGGSIECVVFPSTFDKVSEHLFEERALLVSGRVDERNDTLQIIVDDLRELAENEATEFVPERAAAGQRVVVRLQDVSWEKLNRLSALVTTFRGDDELVLVFELAGRVRAVRVGRKIDWCGEFETAINECLGASEPLYREKMGEDILLAYHPM